MNGIFNVVQKSIHSKKHFLHPTSNEDSNTVDYLIKKSQLNLQQTLIKYDLTIEVLDTTKSLYKSFIKKFIDTYH